MNMIMKNSIFWWKPFSWGTFVSFCLQLFQKEYLFFLCPKHLFNLYVRGSCLWPLSEVLEYTLHTENNNAKLRTTYFLLWTLSNNKRILWGFIIFTVMFAKQIQLWLISYILPVKCSRAVRQKAQVARVHVPGGRQASSSPERVGVACESFS